MNTRRPALLVFTFSMLLQKNLETFQVSSQKQTGRRHLRKLLVFADAPSGRMVSHTLRAISWRRQRPGKFPLKIQPLNNLHRNGMKFA